SCRSKSPSTRPSSVTPIFTINSIKASFMAWLSLYVFKKPAGAQRAELSRALQRLGAGSINHIRDHDQGKPYYEHDPSLLPHRSAWGTWPVPYMPTKRRKEKRPTGGWA